MFELVGKRALVTGATGGIGGAVARALHAQGAQVALSGSREEVLAALAEELGEAAQALPCDLSDAEAAAALAGRANEALGGLDIVVNNAGITRDNLFMRMKDDEWQTVLEVDLTAAFRICRAALRGMMRQRWGRIVNITSVVGSTGNPGQANYAAAKAGLAGMTRGITANCLAPGFVETAMTEALPDEQRQTLAKAIPAGRFGSVDDIAGAVVFLASDEAAYITGQTLHVNGGMAMI